MTLQWRHNECDGVSNHQRLHCLLNCWFRRRSQKTSKLRVTGFCSGNSPVTGEFQHGKCFLFDDVIMIAEWRFPSSSCFFSGRGTPVMKNRFAAPVNTGSRYTCGCLTYHEIYLHQIVYLENNIALIEYEPCCFHPCDTLDFGKKLMWSRSYITYSFFFIIVSKSIYWSLTSDAPCWNTGVRKWRGK